jgi:putative transposase
VESRPYMPELQRKPIRLAHPYYQGYRAYFVTICAKNRRKLFDSKLVVDSLLALLRELTPRFHFDLYAFCFMPDHCHFLLEGKTPNAELPDMIRAFKGRSTVIFRKFEIQDAWQKGFYEHILRTSEDHASVTAYIYENPVRAGPAKDIFSWPFSGSFVIDWSKFSAPVQIFVPLYKSSSHGTQRRVGAEQG